MSNDALAIKLSAASQCSLAFYETGQTRTDIVSSNSVYTLNALTASLRHTYKLPEAQASMEPVNFDSRQPKRRAKNAQLSAERIQGILEFAKERTTTNKNERREIKAITIVGDQKIQNFLYQHLENAKKIHEVTKNQNRGRIKNSLFVTTAAASALITTTDANTLFSPTSIFLLNIFSMKLEGHLYKLGYNAKRKTIENQIDIFSDFLKSAPNGHILHKSQNLQMIKHQLEQTINKFRKSMSKEEFQELIETNETSDFVMKTILGQLITKTFSPFLSKGTFENSNITVDMILEKNKSGESELHYVLRYMDKIPNFPKTQKEKEKDSLTELKPVVSPVRVDR